MTWPWMLRSGFCFVWARLTQAKPGCQVLRAGQRQGEQIGSEAQLLGTVRVTALCLYRLPAPGRPYLPVGWGGASSLSPLHGSAHQGQSRGATVCSRVKEEQAVSGVGWEGAKIPTFYVIEPTWWTTGSVIPDAYFCSPPILHTCIWCADINADKCT